MKIYKVEKYTDHGSSAGFEYCSSKAAAKQICLAHKHQDPQGSWAVASITISMTKDGILRAFNTYASHPDNG